MGLSKVASTLTRLNSLSRIKTKSNDVGGSEGSEGDTISTGYREQRVLAGCTDNLPPLHSKLVRIFTSSTFTGNIMKNVKIHICREISNMISNVTGILHTSSHKQHILKSYNGFQLPTMP